MQTALITGASRGLGRALADSLVADGWRVVVNARSATDLHAAATGWPDAIAIPGDITDDAHRHELAAAIGGRLDLLVLNASSLGQTPLPPLAGYRAEELRAVFETNTVAPLLLVQLTLPALRAAGGTVLAISSDAAVEGYPGWGGYGASKAALDQLVRVLAAEEPDVRALAVDPGDRRTVPRDRCGCWWRPTAGSNTAVWRAAHGASRAGYRWHEFGDVHLILPGG